MNPEDETTQPDTIDRDRLARALHKEIDYPEDGFDGLFCDCKLQADAIADNYDKLAPTLDLSKLEDGYWDEWIHHS